MNRVSKKEAQVLRRRSDELQKKGGLALAEIERRMRAGMVEELHRMARAYDGSPKRAKELLDAILVAEEERISAEVFAQVRREATEAMRGRAA